MPSLSMLVAATSALFAGATALQAYVHDSTFTPDIVLSVTRRNVSVAGIERYSTLINNSLPAPVLTIPEDQVMWIRVYNDMNDANVTMVSHVPTAHVHIRSLTNIVYSIGMD